MSILPCLHSVLTLPGVLSRKQIVLPAVHGADDDAPPERPATAARCAVPGPVPLTGRLRRTCGASGPDRGKPADRQPHRPSARGTLGCRARLGPLSATVIGLTSRAESALDIAGPGRQASPRCSVARTGAGARGETSTAPTATAREPDPLARITPKTPHPRRAEVAVTTARGNRQLDDVAAGERASVRHRAARRTVSVGGSNRLLSVEELAAYLGVPKKTVYGCWRQWGLRGYRVGRYLRFRERHVEEWLQSREV